jgi:TFIIS helical bundle-like domain
MNYAAESDMENNKAGRPGTAKLRVADKVISKLKSTRFALQFLQESGLDVLNKFISKLPDGSWPLSSVRHSILKLIYTLPVTVEQIRSSQLGRTLGVLQTSPKEFLENKKLIQTIKDKWSRVLCDIEVEYARLEQCERALGLPLAMRGDDELLGKRREEEEETQDGLSYSIARPARMGYGFSVRPASVYDSRAAERGRNEQRAELDKYLMRIRRSDKRA